VALQSSASVGSRCVDTDARWNHLVHHVRDYWLAVDPEAGEVVGGCSASFLKQRWWHLLHR
jgi:hypothetical protein